jgi:hypothetical protein
MVIVLKNGRLYLRVDAEFGIHDSGKAIPVILRHELHQSVQRLARLHGSAHLS